jgi:hypothetical protein
MNMGYLKPVTILIIGTTMCACAPSRGRDNDGRSVLWLPTGAATDGGVKCHDDGSCDLSFTASSVDPDALTDELERHFRGAGWEQLCPTTSDRRGWQTFPGGGVIDFGSDAAIPEASRYWHCAWHDAEGDSVTYHLQTSRMRDGRQPLGGYAVYSTR